MIISCNDTLSVFSQTPQLPVLDASLENNEFHLAPRTYLLGLEMKRGLHHSPQLRVPRDIGVHC